MKLKALTLISGGIDSPVASYVLREYEQIPAYFDNFPFAGEDTKQRALDSMKALGFKTAYVLPHGQNLAEFAKNCDRKFQCVLCRRMMFRAASALAERVGCDFIITGENLAQVASQTIQNIYTESSASSKPIIRPLIGLDKEDIIKIAKDIGTYDISVRPAACCMIVPKKPATKSRLERIVAEEAKVNLHELVEKTLHNAKKVDL